MNIDLYNSLYGQIILQITELAIALEPIKLMENRMLPNLDFDTVQKFNCHCKGKTWTIESFIYRSRTRS